MTLARLALIVLAGWQLFPRDAAKPDIHLASGIHAQRALDRPTAGIALGVSQGASLSPVVLRAFGLADAATKAAVGPDTIFHIASVSKYIEAGVLLKLVDQGKLSLDDDITKHVPEAPTQGRRVTLRQLMQHTSGIFSYTAVPNAAANEAAELNHAQVLALIKDRPFDFEPGTSWRYSNTGSYLVGMAIERVTGQPYGVFVRDSVFKPLGMNASSLCTARDNTPGLASGHDVRAGVLTAAAPMSWTLPFAGGGICSTVQDLLRWQRALDAGRLISKARVDDMRVPATLSDGTRIDYGLGTRLGSLGGRLMVGHTGNGGGFNAVLQHFPDDRLSVVVLTNTDSGSALPLATAIARSALEIGAGEPVETPVPATEAAALVGVFDSADGRIENYACGEAVCSRRRGASDGTPLRRMGPYAFSAGPDVEVRFAPQGPRPEWALVYSGGLFVDAKRRVAPEATPAQSGNPILPGWYADPEAHVFANQYWIYPTYSARYDQQTFMDAFSSRDLVTWTKHPRILDAANVSWARRAMWAPSIVEKDGWYYLFFGANDIQNDQQTGGIGVARARQPGGPFTDYLGKPLIDKFHNGAQPIDQFVFKDRDGAHYIVYGGWRHCNIARLNDDFTGLVPFPDGSTFKEITPEGYVEGAFMLLKDGKYYFMWSEGGWTGPNYAVAYAVGSSPFGPFERVGKILQQDPQVATGAGHHSVLHAEGSGKWYIVYHRRPLGETDRDHRVVCIDELTFDANGMIVPVKITAAGVAGNPLPPPR